MTDQRVKQRPGLTWKARLEPHAQAWAQMEIGIEQAIRDYSNAELAKLIEACDQPTMTNCWWATNSVAPLVKQLATAEQNRRRAARDGGKHGHI